MASVKIPKKKKEEIIDLVSDSDGEQENDTENRIIIGKPPFGFDCTKIFDRLLQNDDPTQMEDGSFCDLKKFPDRKDINIGEFDTIKLIKSEAESQKFSQEINRLWLRNNEPSPDLFSNVRSESVNSNIVDDMSVNGVVLAETEKTTNTSELNQNTDLHNQKINDNFVDGDTSSIVTVNDEPDIVKSTFHQTDDLHNQKNNDNSVVICKSDSLKECLRLHKQLNHFKNNEDITAENYSLRVCSNVIDMLDKLLSKPREMADQQKYIVECKNMAVTLGETIKQTFNEKPKLVDNVNSTTKAAINNTCLISIADLKQVNSNSAIEKIENMPKEPTMSWGIRPEDCPWDKVKIFTVEQEKLLDLRASEKDGWLLTGANKKNEIAVNMNKLHTYQVDRSFMQIVENIDARLQFVVYRILNQQKREDRIDIVKCDFDYNTIYSADVIWRVIARNDKISFSIRLVIKNLYDENEPEYMYDYDTYHHNAFMCASYSRIKKVPLACNIKLKYHKNISKKEMFWLLWQNKFESLHGFVAEPTAVHGETSCQLLPTKRFNNQHINRNWDNSKFEKLLSAYITEKCHVTVNFKDINFMKDFIIDPMFKIKEVSRNILIFEIILFKN